MRKFFLSLCLLGCTSAYAGETFLKPLWEEDEHFAYYRVVCIEGSIGAIESLIEEAREYPEYINQILDDMEVHVNNCKNCL